MTQRLLIILSLFSLPSSLLATTFLLTTPEQKIRQSDRVCAAQYLGQAEKKQPSGMCMTTAQFKKIECFKGNVPENFEVVWPGGICTHPQTKKITKTVVPGTPRFIKDQKVVLHLWRKTESHPFTIHTWSHGVIPIHWDQKENDYVLENQPRTLQSPAARGTQTSYQRDLKSRTTLKDFRRKVEDIINE